MQAPRKIPGIIGTVTIRFRLAILLAAVALTLILLYCFRDDWRDQLRFIAIVTGGSAGVFSAYYAATALHTNVVNSRRAATFNLVLECNKLRFDHLRVDIRNRFPKSELSPNAIVEGLQSDDELHAKVCLLLANHEDMALGVKSGYLDEDIAYYSLVGSATAVFDNLLPYIEAERARRRSDEYMIELQHLITRWRRKESIQTGRRYTSDYYPLT